MIKCLSETVPAGTKFYCDPLFMKIPAVDHILKKQLYLTGTVMKNWVFKSMEKLPSDLTLKWQGSGVSATVTRTDGELHVVKLYDNKAIVILCTICCSCRIDTCQRQAKKNKKYVTVT